MENDTLSIVFKPPDPPSPSPLPEPVTEPATELAEWATELAAERATEPEMRETLFALAKTSTQASFESLDKTMDVDFTFTTTTINNININPNYLSNGNNPEKSEGDPLWSKRPGFAAYKDLNISMGSVGELSLSEHSLLEKRSTTSFVSTVNSIDEATNGSRISIEQYVDATPVNNPIYVSSLAEPALGEIEELKKKKQLQSEFFKVVSNKARELLENSVSGSKLVEVPPPPPILTKKPSSASSGSSSELAPSPTALVREEHSLNRVPSLLRNAASAESINDLDKKDQEDSAATNLVRRISAKKRTLFRRYAKQFRSVESDTDDATVAENPITKRSHTSPVSGALWVRRPALDEITQNLDKYFPGHDLDKPIDLLATLEEEAGRLGHRKSIRLIVQERKNSMEIPQTVMLQRSDSKMWGARVAELKAGGITRRKGILKKRRPRFELPAALQSSASQIKWIKGELIGKGSFGRVYHGINAATGDMIAVKQVDIPKRYSGKQSEAKAMINSLYTEIELLKDLDHPNIVSYLGFEVDDDHVNIFLEYVSGGSIASMLKRHGIFPRMVIKDFTRQIINGLIYLHDRNILHRDIKGANILVNEDGICKISDFGISKREELTESKLQIQGSIFWMAPEVVRNAGYSPKVDIWSLGCVVLEMLTAQRPWVRYPELATMYKLGQYTAPPVPGNLDDETLDFLKLCFKGKPEDRPSAEELSKSPICEIEETYDFSSLIRKVGPVTSTSMLIRNSSNFRPSEDGFNSAPAVKATERSRVSSTRISKQSSVLGILSCTRTSKEMGTSPGLFTRTMTNTTVTMQVQKNTFSSNKNTNDVLLKKKEPLRRTVSMAVNNNNLDILHSTPNSQQRWSQQKQPTFLMERRVSEKGRGLLVNDPVKPKDFANFRVRSLDGRTNILSCNSNTLSLLRTPSSRMMMAMVGGGGGGGGGRGGLERVASGGNAEFPSLERLATPDKGLFARV